MFDLILLRGRGIEGMLAIEDFSNPFSSSIFNGCKKSLIPPFESEVLKAEKNSNKKSGKGKNRLPEILLVAAFIVFDLAVFLLCYFLPE